MTWRKSFFRGAIGSASPLVPFEAGTTSCSSSLLGSQSCHLPFLPSFALFSAAKYSFAFPDCSAEYACTSAKPSSSSALAKFSRPMYIEPMKPPTLSVFSTSISTSLCMHLLFAKSAASCPKGSAASPDTRAGFGTRMPESTNVSLAFSRGINNTNLPPPLTKSTTAGTFFCFCRVEAIIFALAKLSE